MDLSTLESWLWQAACSIRGEVDAARYKDYILPLVFYKRLDDVYADDLARVAQRLGVDVQTAEGFVGRMPGWCAFPCRPWPAGPGCGARRPGWAKC